MENQIQRDKVITELHNKYDIEIINKNNQIINKFTAYNKADSSAFVSVGYIDRMFIIGVNNSERYRYIEPYGENEGDTITDYWDRNGLPYSTSSKFVSCYKADVFFPAAEAGTIEKVQLRGADKIISEANLTDIEGNNIIIYSFSANKYVLPL